MKKILIVDDDQAILEVVSVILTSYSFDVKTHSTGFNVPGIVLYYQPDLILLDICLPGKLGTEICKELKELNPKIPIILFSANSNIGTNSCANAFISKPCDMQTLIDTINLHLNLIEEIV